MALWERVNPPCEVVLFLFYICLTATEVEVLIMHKNFYLAILSWLVIHAWKLQDNSKSPIFFIVTAWPLTQNCLVTWPTLLISDTSNGASMQMTGAFFTGIERTGFFFLKYKYPFSKIAKKTKDWWQKMWFKVPTKIKHWCVYMAWARFFFIQITWQRAWPSDSIYA